MKHLQIINKAFLEAIQQKNIYTLLAEHGYSKGEVSQWKTRHEKTSVGKKLEVLSYAGWSIELSINPPSAS